MPKVTNIIKSVTGNKDDLKKALKEQTKKKIIRRVVITVIILLLVIGLIVLMASALLSSIAALFGFDAMPEAGTEVYSDDCPCGCVLLGQTTVQSNGSYGYTTGSLASGTGLTQQVLTTLYSLSQLDGGQSSHYLPVASWSIMYRESGSKGIEALYTTANPNIWTDMMRHAESSGSTAEARVRNAYDLPSGADWSTAPMNYTIVKTFTENGRTVNNVSNRTGKNWSAGHPRNGIQGFNCALGPFQIEPAYISSWAPRVPDNVAQSLGGTVANWASRANGDGSPFYLPDVMYGQVTNLASKIDEAYLVLATGISSSDWNTLTEDGKNLAANVLALLSYNAGNIGGYADISAEGSCARYLVYNYIKCYLDDPTTLRNDASKWKASPIKLAEYLYGRGYTTGLSNYLRYLNDFGNTYAYCAFIDGIYNYEVSIGVLNVDADGNVTGTFGSSMGKWPSGIGTGSTNLSSTVTGAVSSTAVSTTGTTDWSRVVLIGDSLTVGMNNKVSEIASLGVQVNAEVGRGLSIYDKGTASQSTGTMIADIQWGDVDTIVINIGTNSVGDGTGFQTKYEQFIADIDNDIRDYEQTAGLTVSGISGKRLYLGTMLPVVEKSTHYAKEAGITSGNEAIKNVAQAYGAELIDGYSLIKNAGISPDSDGLHYNSSSEAYQKWWELIKATVQSTGGGTASAVSSGTLVGTSVVQNNWSCTCLRPCPYCSCHDNEDANGNLIAGAQQVGISSRTFPDQTPGETSGLFGTADEMRAWLNSDSSYTSWITKSQALAALNYVGTAPCYKNGVSSYDKDRYDGKPAGTTDRYVGADGYGVIMYNQGSPSAEPMGYLTYRGSTEMYEASCGLYAASCVLSTLEKKWVTPAELLVAAATQKARTSDAYTSPGAAENGAMWNNTMVYLFKELGYTVVDSSSAGTFKDNKDTIDECLRDGGMVIACFGNEPVTKAGSGHYIVLRDIVSGGEYDGYYLMANSVYSRESNTGVLSATDSKGTRLVGLYTHSSLTTNLAGGGTNWLAVWPKAGQEPTYGATTAGAGSGNTATFPVFGYGADGNPVPVQASCDFWRNDSFDAYQFHKAVDCGPNDGGGWDKRAVYAVADGVVREAKFDSSRGYYVTIEHTGSGGNWVTLYQHLTAGSILVKSGDKVTAGTQIALSGNTGRSTGAHLHIEVWPCSYSDHTTNNIYVDPAAVIQIDSLCHGSVQGGQDVFTLTRIRRDNSVKGVVTMQGTDYVQLQQRFSYVTQNAPQYVQW